MNEVQKDNGRNNQLHTTVSDLTKSELSMNQCTVTNRNIYYSSNSQFCQSRKEKKQPWEKVP